MAEGFDLNSLLQNKMFLQMLSAGGADLMQGTGGTNLNTAVQGNISSQNFAKMLKQLLGPDGTKATLSNAGINLTIPKETEMFKSLLSGGGENWFSEDKSLMRTPSVNIPSLTQPSAESGVSSYLNPFAESQPNTPNLNFSMGDLAGLSPQDIVAALGIKQSQDELKNKTIAQMTEADYRNKLMENLTSEIEARTPKFEIPGVGKVNASQYIEWQKLEKEGALDKPFPIQVPGIGQVTLRQWAALPDPDRQYAIAVSQAAKLGDETFMSKDDWLATRPTEKENFIREAMRDPALMKAAERLAKAGANNFGDKIAEKKAISELQGQDYFNNPNWTEDVDKQMQSFDKNQAWLIPEEQRPLAKAKAKVKAIEDKILAGGGTVQSVAMDKDGKTMIWIVKWPTGDFKAIRQAVR